MPIRFKHKCLIRKNSKTIRDNLEKLGYDDYWTNDDSIALCTWDINYKMISYAMKNEITPVFVGLDNEDDIGDYLSNDVIDCGYNLLLFFALAAVQDDSDINQWFRNDNEWVKCLDDKFEKDGFHKASLEELIEHFSVE